MCRNTLPQTAIDQIKAAGYRVFMQDRSNSYAVYGDDDNVGYVEYDPTAGYTVSTVHYPNRESGTGFQVARHIDALSDDVLHDGAKIVKPSWALGVETPQKYHGVENYRSADTFNARYTEV